jgi:hypothetical protein
MSLKKERKNQVNPSKSSKYKLILQTRNPLNFKPKVNQEVQFPTNFIFKDETRKNYQRKNLSKAF